MCLVPALSTSGCVHGNRIRSTGWLIPGWRNWRRRLRKRFSWPLCADMKLCYYDKVEGRRNVRMGSLIGNFAPVYCTGVGKAILAFLPKAKQDEILNSAHRERFTPNTLVSLKAIREDLKKISLCGVAVDDCEHEQGVFCIAAPILDSTGQAIAGISLSGSELYLRGNVKALSKQVLNTACAISDSYNGR